MISNFHHNVLVQKNCLHMFPHQPSKKICLSNNDHFSDEINQNIEWQLGFLPSKTTVGTAGNAVLPGVCSRRKDCPFQLVKYKSKLNAVHFVVLSDDYFIFLQGYMMLKETHNYMDRWAKVKVSMAQLCLIFVTPWAITYQVFCPGNSPGKNTGMGSHSLLQGIFLTQGLNPGLLHCR